MMKGSTAIRSVLLLWLAGCAGACTGVQPLMAPAGPEARSIADLGWFVLITFSVITVIMWVLIVWVALRRRGSLTEHAPWNAPNDKRWILIGGFGIPAAVLTILFVLTLRTMSAFPMEHADMGTGLPDIVVTAHQWWWEVQYQMGPLQDHVVTANEIHIPAGQPIDIALQSRDVIHSFWMPRLHGKVDVLPGQVNEIRLQADAPGRFRGECAEYCGPQHAHMILTVVADSPTDFQKWLANERRPAAATAGDPFLGRGEALVTEGPCAMCHTVRGTMARGLVGPDLTHIGSRAGIASNAYPNETSYLEAWVTHAQSLKPDAQMPNITAFSGDDLRAIVSYLQHLK